MVQSSTSRSQDPEADKPDNSSFSATAVSGSENGLEYSLKQLALTLSAHSERDLAADLALDLVLNSIVEQAKLATNANAAAIALSTAGEMVCRATTGTNAPDLGVRLDSQYGLSGACVRTGAWQRCDDTESDTRVNAEACRYLGVRSILVYPLMKGDQLLGVMEIFSSRANAFSDREIHTLEALSGRVVENLDHATGVLSPAVDDEAILSDVPAPEPAFLEDVPAALPAATLSRKEEDAPAIVPAAVVNAKRRPDLVNALLTGLVIALAVTLGWLIGHVGRQQRAAGNPPKISAPAQVVSTTQTPAPVKPAATAPPAVKETKKEPVTAAKDQNQTDPQAGLVVYDKGKVIFRMNQPDAANSNGISSASLRSKDQSSGDPANLSPAAASQYLVGRVEPDYPEQAREQHVQGAVVLQVLVGKSGVVENVQTVSGDSTLASAATDAVRQWQFRPFLQGGHPQPFQTEVTVSFRMP